VPKLFVSRLPKGDNPFNSVKLFQCCFGAQSEKGLSLPCTDDDERVREEEKNKGNYTTYILEEEEKLVGPKGEDL